MKKKEKAYTINCLIDTLLITNVQVTCTKKYARQKEKRNENKVHSIKEVLNKTKEDIKNVPENKKINIDENEKIILLNIFFTSIN